MFRDETRLKLQDSALNAAYMGSVESFRSSVKIENATDDNVTAGGGLNGYIGFYASPELVKSSSGTLTLGTGFGFYSAPNTIDSGETIGNYYGFRAVSPTNNGTLTDNYGYFASTITGANRHPYSAAQGAITGSTKADEGDWGVENTSNTTLYFKNDAQQVWRTPTYKTANQSRVSTATLADDDTLKFAVAANTKYRFKVVVFFDTGATGDFKYALSCPASPSLVRVQRDHILPGATTRVVAVDQACTASTAAAGTGTNGGFVSMEGVFHNGANAGTVAFQWAQNTSDGTNTTVLAGSFIEWATI
jgi:hypothetical protein